MKKQDSCRYFEIGLLVGAALANDESAFHGCGSKLAKSR
jgi:hypothetical protein